MIDPDARALIVYWLQTARETMTDARHLVEIGGGAGSTINRAYYAMFYCVLGLATLKQFAPRKHQGAIAFFDREFVHTGVFPKTMSEALHEMFDLRLEADYADFSEPSPEEVTSAMEKAELFVNTVTTYLREQIGETNERS